MHSLKKQYLILILLIPLILLIVSLAMSPDYGVKHQDTIVLPESTSVTPSDSTVTPSGPSATVLPESTSVTPSDSTVTPSGPSATVLPESTSVTPSESTVLPSSNLTTPASSAVDPVIDILEGVIGYPSNATVDPVIDTLEGVIGYPSNATVDPEVSTLVGIVYRSIDVAVVDVTPSKAVVGQGFPMSINVTIRNQGYLNETFGMIVYSGSLGDPTPEQTETFWSMGDVNRDGYINDLDMDLILEAWGSTPGSPNWNPDADINQDYIVDLADMYTCLQNYDKNIWAHFDLALVIDGQTVVDLPPGLLRDFAFTWNTTDFAKGNYTLTAYAIPLLSRSSGEEDETDTADNTFTDGWVIVAMIGDITGPDGWPDGKCDMRDIGVAARAFGSYPGHPNWDPEADINQDYKVDMRDVGTVARHFGETDP